MNTYWYTSDPNSLYGNVGDMLTPLLVEHFSGRKPDYAPADHVGKLLAVGSVAEFICDNDTVWGSGLIQPMGVQPKKNVTILAVRGKKTAEHLRAFYQVPDVFGDPACLMPQVYPKDMFDRIGKYKQGFIPHYIEANEWGLEFQYGDGIFISILNHPKDFIAQMLECRKIITSSLHAYILAQAYGLEAEYVQLTSKIIGGYFKYKDYISGRGDSEKLKQAFVDYCQNLCEST